MGPIRKINNRKRKSQKKKLINMKIRDINKRQIKPNSLFIQMFQNFPIFSYKITHFSNTCGNTKNYFIPKTYRRVEESRSRGQIAEEERDVIFQKFIMSFKPNYLNKVEIETEIVYI